MIIYNNITVPLLIKVDRIFSAFQNEISEDKVNEYAEIMKNNMLNHDFPPIKGFPSLYDEDVDLHRWMDWDNHLKPNNGDLIWNVTDGHHRSLAAIIAELPHLEVELDYSCIASDEDLKNYKIAQNAQ